MVDVLLGNSRSPLLIRSKAELDKMEERKYLLLPAEIVVVDAAPAFKEFPILRFPQRGRYSGEGRIHRRKKTPNMVVFRLEEENTVTFMGLMSQTGNKYSPRITRNGSL